MVGNGSKAGRVALVSAGLWAVMVVSGPDLAEAQSAAELFSTGDWEEARQEAWIRDDAESLRVRALLAHWDGEDEEALRFAQVAAQVESAPAAHRRAQIMLARLEWFGGSRDEALLRLREVLQRSPDDLEARFELGWRLIDDGEAEEGRAVLEAVARRYNDGLVSGSQSLTWVGRSMMAAGRARDANRALSRAVQADEENVEAHLRLGQLMLSRSNTAEAEASFEEVLTRQPDHPEALVAMAEIEFFRSGRFALARELISRAMERHGEHPEVARGRGRLLLAQGAWREALEVAQGLLARAPLDSDALALQAAAAYLLGDQKTFEASQARYDERRSRRAQLLTFVAESAVLNRRQREAIAHFEAAIEREPDHGPALSGLGLALARLGEEARAVAILERAFAVDRYHVRVYNTLEFYDRGLRDYITDDVGPFRLRAHTSQFDLLRELTLQHVGEARREYSQRYGMELDALTLEVYPDPEAFSVRSVGLPHIDPHGICFGPVVLTRSPGAGDFNWALVLWHELAHSYHLALSRSRVPRWFTEGLSEYETWRHDASWTRFHQVDLARRVAHGRMWSIAEMDEVFMTGRGAVISQVYQAAQLIMAYLEEHYGFEAILTMLRRFGEESRSEVVFEEVLGQAIKEIDAGFQSWLKRELGGLSEQELIDWDRLVAMRQGEEVEHRSSAEGSAYRALLAAHQGEEVQAGIHLDNALSGAVPAAGVGLVAVSVYDQLDEVEAGLNLGQKMLSRGVESFDLRVLMTRLSVRAERDEEAYVHSLAATMLAPTAPEVWQELRIRAAAVGEGRIAAQAAAEAFARQPHSAPMARQRVLANEENQNWTQALMAARRWSQIAALDAEAHLAVASNAARLGELAEAEQAWKNATLAAPARREAILEQAAVLLRGLGAEALAQKLQAEIGKEND